MSVRQFKPQDSFETAPRLGRFAVLGATLFRTGAVAAALSLSGCMAYAARASAVSKLAPDAAFTCALQQVTKMGYSVQVSERAGGLIRAEKQTASGTMQFLTGSQYFTELNIAVLPGGDGSELTVNAESKQARTILGRQAQPVTKEAKADADSLRARCAG